MQSEFSLCDEENTAGKLWLLLSNHINITAYA